MRTIQKPVVFGQAGFQSPSPHSSRGFAARLIVGSTAKTLFRVRLQSRQLRRLVTGGLPPPVGPLTAVSFYFVNENKNDIISGHSCLLHLQWPLRTNVIETPDYAYILVRIYLSCTVISISCNDCRLHLKQQRDLVTEVTSQ